MFLDKQEHQGVHTERSASVRGRDGPGLPRETDRLDAHTAGAEGPLQVSNIATGRLQIQPHHNLHHILTTGILSNLRSSCV